MEIWITRQADRGLLITEYSSPDEIEEGLKGLECYDEFSSGEEVKVELTARWDELKQFFQDIQHLSDYVMTPSRKPGIIVEIIGRLKGQRFIK